MNEVLKYINKIKSINDELLNTSSKASEVIKSTNEFSHYFLIELTKHGWYVNSYFYITDFSWISEQIKSNNIELVNDFVINNIKKNYELLKTHTLTVFKEKENIFKKAFYAFENFDYEYSILIFLTQTDSICKNLTGKRFFGREDKQPKTKKIASKHFNKNLFASAILQPLADYGEINKSESDYKNGEFNRHRIIHGEDVNFGSEINAYKMLSLIFYLTTLVLIKNDKTSPPDRTYL
ncbi:MAG TPA: hypothetical protein PLC59_11210 [Bacteroidales bacterium]|nr:hypothetical protein [Bacteroidales bacterium]